MKPEFKLSKKVVECPLLVEISEQQTPNEEKTNTTPLRCGALIVLAVDEDGDLVHTSAGHTKGLIDIILSTPEVLASVLKECLDKK